MLDLYESSDHVLVVESVKGRQIRKVLECECVKGGEFVSQDVLRRIAALVACNQAIPVSFLSLLKAHLLSV